MSMTLRKINRAELVEQIEFCIKNGKSDKSHIGIYHRSGIVSEIVKVTEDAHGVFLCPFFKDDPIIGMAKLFGSSVHVHTPGEIVDALKRATHDDVWLQWPTEKTRTVVGKVLAVGTNDEMKVCLTPVPKDIEQINEEVRRICAKKCKSAEAGLQCGDCEACGICKVLEDADREITERKEK